MKPYEFYDSPIWQGADLELSIFRFVDPEAKDGKSLARSFSGHERNRLFMQTDENFDDVSLVSGVDFPKDSRGFVLWDFDNDGWIDMGVTSPLSPRFQIFRNKLGQTLKGNSAFLTVEGGNDKPKKSKQWSSRDAVGAKLLVSIRDKNRMFQRSCGEGLASQNSKWIHVGMGGATEIDQVKVVWPSGRETVHQGIQAGQRVVLLEDGTMRVQTD